MDLNSLFHARYSFDQPLYIKTEVDGARILTKDHCEFIERVPDSTEEIFKIGSTKPAALLYDAWQNFEVWKCCLNVILEKRRKSRRYCAHNQYIVIRSCFDLY